MKKRVIQRILWLVVLCIFPFGKGITGIGNINVMAAADGQAGYPNPSYTFTSTEGQEVNTTANNKQTTVLLFGSTKCANTQRTLKSVSSSDWVGNSGIRVIFAECNRASLQEMKSFIATYGCDAITFCYDNENYYSSIYNAMWEYYDLFFDSSAGGTMPFTVLIDENNQVRQVFTGSRTADAIMDEIKKFAVLDYEETNPKFKIDMEGIENYTYANEVFQQVNQARKEKGLPELKLDKELMEAAMQRAAEISMYYSHTRPDGSQCFTVSSRGTYKAENIATGYLTPAAVMKGWLSSQGHYENIMDTNVTSIGIGCFQDSQGTWNWVQFFDNVQGNTSTLSESRRVTRTVSIQKSFLHLQCNDKQNFTESDKNKTIKMSVHQINETWEHSKPELSLSNFNFKSSNMATAEVGEDGIITLKEPGTAVITASLKADEKVFVNQTIEIKKNIQTEPDFSDKQDTNNNSGNAGDAVDVNIANISGLKAGTGKNSIKLKWNNQPKAQGYLVYQYDNGKKKWTKIADLKAGQTSYGIKKLKTGTTYRFAVKAYMTLNGKMVASKKYASLYTATNPAAVKFSVKPGKKKAVLKWKNVKGATGYKVYYKTSETGKWKNIKNTKKSSCTIKKLKSGKKYIFTVKAYKTYKGKTYTGSGTTKKIKIK